MHSNMRRRAQRAIGVEDAVRVAVRNLNGPKNNDQPNAEIRQQQPPRALRS